MLFECENTFHKYLHIMHISTYSDPNHCLLSFEKTYTLHIQKATQKPHIVKYSKKYSD